MVVADKEVFDAVDKTKHEFNRWVAHYVSEPANWPMDSVYIWSVGQTLHPSNLDRFGLGEEKDPASKQNISEGVVNYLHQEASNGLEKWLSDRIGEYGGIFLNEKDNSKSLPLVYAGVKLYPELERKWNEVLKRVGKR